MECVVCSIHSSRHHCPTNHFMIIAPQEGYFMKLVLRKLKSRDTITCSRWVALSSQPVWAFHYISEQLHRAQKETRAQTLGVVICCPDLPFNDPHLACRVGSENSFHVKRSEGSFGYKEPQPSINSPARSQDACTASGAPLRLSNSHHCLVLTHKISPASGEEKAWGARWREQDKLQRRMGLVLIRASALSWNDVSFLVFSFLILNGGNTIFRVLGSLVIVAKNRWSLNGADGDVVGGGGNSCC